MFDPHSNKFEVLKGIIKIYNITSQGNQIIESVSAFNTDNLISFEQKERMITKTVGPIYIEFKIKTEIEVCQQEIYNTSLSF